MELEVDGVRYKLRALTFEEASQVFSLAQARALRKLNLTGLDVDSEAGEQVLAELLTELRIQLLKACVEEPKLSDKDIRAMPSSIGRKLLEACIELNPDFRGL